MFFSFKNYLFKIIFLKEDFMINVKEQNFTYDKILN